MTMNRHDLLRYAEAGVRERLRDIQRELEMLARDFPHLVRNADGSLPSVLPVTKKQSRAAFAAAAHGNGHQPHTTPAARTGASTARLRKQRAATVKTFQKFSTTTARPGRLAGRALGSYVRRGYLVKADAGGYLRTAKPYTP